MIIVISESGQMSNKKSRTRLYIDCEFNSGDVHLVAANQGHYLVNVLRVQVGEIITVFNGRDGEWKAEVIKVGKGKAKISIGIRTAEQTEEADIWYLYAPVKKARVDYIIQKATELGVKRISPVVTKRTNLDRIKYEKLVANAIEAAEQSGRMTVPAIDELFSLEDKLRGWPSDRVLIFCDESGATNAMNGIDPAFNKWAILVGPEGGFSPDERDMIMNQKNAIAISLGPRILRADTAAVAALSLWQTYFGDWHA